MKDLLLMGEQYYLRPVEKNDINDTYLSWMRDKDVTRYLVSGKEEQTLETLMDYWQKNQNNHTYFLAIIDRNTDKHIGNARLVVADDPMRIAEFGMLIGEKEYWGKSCMFDVYGLLCEFAFNKLKVKKITLHSEVDNIAAIITFKKLGFKIEKTLKNHLFKNDRYINIIRFGYPYEDYIKNKIEK